MNKQIPPERLYGYAKVLGVKYYDGKKADMDGVSLSRYDDPEQPARSTMSITVRHGTSASDRAAAVQKAHGIAAQHGMDVKSARVSTNGYGDSHSTTCNYNAK